MSTTYKPNPLDTSHIELPSELLPLREQIAEQVHERWSAERIAQGWQFGPVRDDAKKHHPCLVPYAELSDAERMFDRVTAETTLKMVISLGFELVKRK